MFFTYLFGWTNQNKFYYGVRYKDGCSVSSLGTTYFSSSVYVRDFIEKHGLPDVVEVRKIFTDKLSAKRWEDGVLRRLRVVEKDKWLNRSNNNSFKNTVMTEEIKKKISAKAKGRGVGSRVYNDGVSEIRIMGDVIPQRFVRGALLTERKKLHREKLNARTYAERKLSAIKCAEKTRGKKKPAGFGEKISLALKGKPKPWNLGDKNPSKSLAARKKISDSWSTRIRGTWCNDGGTNYYFIPGEKVPDNLIVGKRVINKQLWYTDGVNNTRLNMGDIIPQNYSRGMTRK